MSEEDHRDLHEIAGVRALIITPSPDPLAGLRAGSLERAQAEARIALEGFRVWDTAREEVGRALKKLSPEGRRLLAELLTGELQRRSWGSGREPDAVTPDLIDEAQGMSEAANRHDRGRRLADVMWPLVVWWETENGPVTTTVGQNPKRTDERHDDGASAGLRFLAAEMTRLLDETITPQRALSLLGHLRS